MPLKLIRLSGSLADESFPGYIGSDTGITVSVSNPADHSIRIYGNGIIPANIAQLPSDNTATYAFLPLAVSVEVARPFWESTPTPMKRTL